MTVSYWMSYYGNMQILRHHQVLHSGVWLDPMCAIFIRHWTSGIGHLALNIRKMKLCIVWTCPHEQNCRLVKLGTIKVDLYTK